MLTIKKKIMNITFYNGEILKKKPLENKDERIILGANSQCKCYLYDSKRKIQELKDYDQVKAAQRKYIFWGEKKNYREIYFVFVGAVNTFLQFEDRRPMRNTQGIWVCKNYKLNLKIRVIDPPEIIQKNISNVNFFIKSEEFEIRKMVLRCKNGAELRTELNARFKATGLYIDYVSVCTDETSTGISEIQRKHNETITREIEAKSQNKLTDIREDGRRVQQMKDAQNQVEIKKLELALSNTERMVLLNTIASLLQNMKLSDKEKMKGIVTMASVLGTKVPPHIVDLLTQSKKRRNSDLILP